MNKLTLILSIVLWIAASCCESLEMPLSNDQSALPVLTKALDEANNGGVTESDVEAYLKCRMNVPSSTITSITSYEVDSSTRLYVAKVKDGRWFLFSGDYNMPPILAEGDDNNPCPADFGKTAKWLMSISSQDATKDPDAALDNRLQWLHAQRAATLVKEGNTRSGDDTSEVYYEYVYDTLSSLIYPALTQTHWHGGSPWNNNIPKLQYGTLRCYAGDEVVAIAQLLYYTHFAINRPTNTYVSANCMVDYTQYQYQYNFGTSTTSTWNYMPMTNNGNSLYNSYVDAFIAHVASRLCTEYNVTDPLTSDPDDSYSVTGEANVAAALNEFLSLNLYTGENFSLSYANASIQNNLPVICYDLTGSNVAPQSFLLDGYQHYYIKETEVVRDINGVVLSTTVSYYSSSYWHINAGVGAVSNYYWVTVIAPQRMFRVN